MKLVLVANKVTKNKVRFADPEDESINIYLSKDEVTGMGLKVEEGQKISVTIVKSK